MKTLERGSGRGSIARSPVLGNPALDANQLNERDERYDRVASGQNVEGDVLRTRRKGRVRHVFFCKFEVCVRRSGEERGRAAHLSLRVGPPALLIARRPGRGGSGGVASPEHPVDRHVGALLCGGAKGKRAFSRARLKLERVERDSGRLFLCRVSQLTSIARRTFGGFDWKFATMPSLHDRHVYIDTGYDRQEHVSTPDPSLPRAAGELGNFTQPNQIRDLCVSIVD